MRRADRLFRIVQYLRGGRLTTARDLAGKLEVRERTVYRDVADLIGSGVPIEGEAGVGHVMRAGYDVPPLMFTRSEVAALVAGARKVKAWGDAALARAAEEALVKIAAGLPETLRESADQVPIHALTFDGLDPADREMLDRLEAACNTRNRLSIAYADVAGQKTARTIRPLGLQFWGRTWTLIAECEPRDAFRMFLVDRISSAKTGAPIRPERDKNLTAFYAEHGLHAQN